LASLGFSEADIADIRLQFHSQTLSDFLDDQQFEGEDACKLDFVDQQYTNFRVTFLDIEHARSLEERWIESADGAASVTLSQSRNSSLMQGILTGFFFPILPLFFLAKLNPPVFWDNGEDFEPPENVVFSYVYVFFNHCTITHVSQEDHANGHCDRFHGQFFIRAMEVSTGELVANTCICMLAPILPKCHILL
jgi:hypothetical protein